MISQEITHKNSGTVTAVLFLAITPRDRKLKRTPKPGRSVTHDTTSERFWVCVCGGGGGGGEEGGGGGEVLGDSAKLVC